MQRWRQLHSLTTTRHAASTLVQTYRAHFSDHCYPTRPLFLCIRWCIAAAHAALFTSSATMLRRSLLRALFAGLVALSSTALVSVSAATAPTPNSVKIASDSSVTVDGAAFKVKGVAYSPVPNGESVNFAPHGGQ